MTDLAAPATILVRRRASGALLELDPALELGAGGEARVYEVPGVPEIVAKVYRHPTPERARKVELMASAPPVLPADGGAALAWPSDVLLDAGGRFAGFLMPRAEGSRVFELYNPVTRRRGSPLFHHGLLHRAAANLAAAFDALHARGYVVGDVNESNILLAPDARVTLVDADSFQVRDPVSGIVFRSHVGKAEFTPPELQGRAFAEFDRAPEHDRFGLAVLVFLLLMEGNHPFAARLASGAETPPVEERIRRGLFPYASPDPDCLPPRLAPPFELLHPALRDLFARCFVEAGERGAERPTARAWREALEVAEAELAPCARNPQHRVGAHLGHCPWCERASLLGGRDPFPATADEARAVERTRLPAPPRPRAVAAAAPAFFAAPRIPFAAPAPAVQGNWMTAVAGPAGLRHPGVWLLPAVMVAGLAQVAMLQTLAFLGFLAALALLCWKGVPQVRGVTAATSIGITLFVLWAAGVGGAFSADHGRYVKPRIPSAYNDPYLGTYVAPEPPPPPAFLDDGEGGFATGAVDQDPVLLNEDEVTRAVMEVYPPRLRAAGVSGSVALRFRVNAEGYPDLYGYEVVSATHNSFVRPAVNAARLMRFDPARLGGQPVDVWVTVPITFRLGTE